MEPGKIYEFHIEMFPTSFVLQEGHQLTIEISSSNFPHFDRNLNSGEDLATGKNPFIAEQVIFHSTGYPSHVILPVIPQENRNRK